MQIVRLPQFLPSIIWKLVHLRSLSIAINSRNLYNCHWQIALLLSAKINIHRLLKPADLTI